MNLQFTEEEITAGVRHAVGLMGFDLTGKELTVDYSMGRGKNGLSAQVTITNPAIPKAAPAVVIKGFTDTDEVKEDTKSAGTVEATTDAASATTETGAGEPEVAETTATGADATTLFGDDD